jgi:hypothetical protein
MAEADKLKVGDKVMWRGNFGSGHKVMATVENIEICPEGSKHGRSVGSVLWSAVKTRRVVIDLDNSHWCYGNQVDKI